VNYSRAFVLLSASHLYAKDLREPPRSDAALWRRTKREATFPIASLPRASHLQPIVPPPFTPTPPGYFNFTNNKTKIAHTPTVIGNCAKAASRTGPPRGSANVRKNITSAVSIPTTNLLFQFMNVLPRHAPSPTSSQKAQPHVSARVYPEGARYTEELEGRAGVFSTSRDGEERDSVSEPAPERSHTVHEAPYGCNWPRLLKKEVEGTA
jgi:hypothetical protein